MVHHRSRSSSLAFRYAALIISIQVCYLSSSGTLILLALRYARSPLSMYVSRRLRECCPLHPAMPFLAFTYMIAPIPSFQDGYPSPIEKVPFKVVLVIKPKGGTFYYWLCFPGQSLNFFPREFTRIGITSRSRPNIVPARGPTPFVQPFVHWSPVDVGPRIRSSTVPITTRSVLQIVQKIFHENLYRIGLIVATPFFFPPQITIWTSLREYPAQNKNKNEGAPLSYYAS